MLSSTEFLRPLLPFVPQVGLVLGSGLGILEKSIEPVLTVDYREIPGFPASTVPGHAGHLLLGKIHGVPVICMCGRMHHYEGYSHQELAYPIRTMKQLGTQTLLLTAAVGGIDESYRPGDLCLVSDHINFSGQNPLFGPNDDTVGPRFPDMSRAYSPRLRQLVRQAAEEQCIPLKEGVYILMNGPSFETPAEIRMSRILGAQVVGMSTVPEVIAANHCGLPVAALCTVTNMAAGILDQPLTHQEVLETTARVEDSVSRLVCRSVEFFGQE